MADAFKYRAFISYSHKDKIWCDWLHRALENYRIPGRLVGKPGCDGPVPKTLYPIFRDREELSASSDLSTSIKAALAESACLVVICSTASAKSHWVNEEILAFKRLGRSSRVFALIVNGEPNAAEAANPGDAECFPPALKFTLGADGELSSIPAEPIAADARQDCDGKENAKLKLVAGLLGIGYDELKQREAEAKRARLIAWTLSIAATVTLFFGVIAYFLVGQARDANATRFVAEANGDLTQRDYARAEIAAAKALTYRDDPEARELLLEARLGGVRSPSRSAKASGTMRSNMNIFSRDGKMLATVLASPDLGQLSIIVSQSGQRKTQWKVALPNTAGIPDSLEISGMYGNERLLAVAWPDRRTGTVFRTQVWRLIDGRPAIAVPELSTNADFGRHTKRISSLAFHPKERWLATSGEDGKICLWDLSQDAPKLIWDKVGAHYPDVNVIVFNADGSRLASAGGDYLVDVWKTSDMAGKNYNPQAPYAPHAVKPLYTLKGHQDAVFAIAFSQDGQRLASGGYDSTIRIWDMTPKSADEHGTLQPETVETLSGHEGTILALSFSSDGTLLLSGASDQSARLWDVNGSRLLDKFTPGDGIIGSVSMTDFDGGVKLGGESGWSFWSLRGGALLRRAWTGATVGAVSFDPNGRYLATGGSGDDGKILVWDRSLNLVRTLDPQSPGEGINTIAFSPDGHWLAAAGGNQVIHMWDIPDGWKLQGTKANTLSHDGAIWGLCFDPNGKWLASSNESHNTPQDIRIKRWRVGDWALIDQSKRLGDQVYSIACDASGSQIVSGDSRAHVTVYAIDPLRPIATSTDVHQGPANVWSVAILPRPHSILSGASDGRVYSWVPDEWAPFNEGNTISTSANDAKVNPTINSIAYNSKNGWIAAAGIGPSIEIYNTELHHRYSLRVHNGTIWWLTFDPSGQRLSYGGLDGVVDVIDVDELQRLDTASPQLLFQESERSTGLTVEKGEIVESTPN